MKIAMIISGRAARYEVCLLPCESSVILLYTYWLAFYYLFPTQI